MIIFIQKEARLFLQSVFMSCRKFYIMDHLETQPKGIKKTVLTGRVLSLGSRLGAWMPPLAAVWCWNTENTKVLPDQKTDSSFPGESSNHQGQTKARWKWHKWGWCVGNLALPKTLRCADVWLSSLLVPCLALPKTLRCADVWLSSLLVPWHVPSAAFGNIRI